MQKLTVFRPKGNLVWGATALVLDGLFLGQSIFYPGAGANLAADVATCGVLGVAAAALWLRPKLVLRESDLVVVNPVRKTVIAYKDIQELETKWALKIHHTGGKTSVWVAPANGKQRWISESTFRWRSTDRIPVTSDNAGEMTSISGSLKSDSGLAAHLIRERIGKKH